MNAELEKWMDVWAKAQEKNLFPTTPKQEVNTQKYETDYFGNVRKDDKKKVSLNDCDAKYWNQVHSLAKGGKAPIITEQVSKVKGIATEEPLESEPLKKQRETPAKSDLAQKGDELANTANPLLEPASRGEDQRNHVTPERADGKGVRELVSMKSDLSKLQIKLNSHPKFGAYGPEAPEIKKIQSKIDELNHKIDDLSNSLSPSFVDDELS